MTKINYRQKLLALHSVIGRIHNFTERHFILKLQFMFEQLISSEVIFVTAIS